MTDPLTFQSKLPDVGTTIFTVMSKMALDYNAINLSQGFPDYDIEDNLRDLVTEAMKSGHNQYAPMPGVPLLLENIARKINRLYHINVDPHKEITITCGATEAIYSTISALVHAGDEVIVIEPAYDSYVPSILVNGGIPVFVSMKFPSCTIDWDEVRGKITSRTRMIMINTPHNPTGTILTNSDMLELSSIVEQFGIYVLSDEVYEHIVYDDQPHESILKYPVLREKGIATYSFGKTFHATGWRVGYSVSNPEINKEIRKVHQFNTFSIPTPLQFGLAKYLEDPKNYEGIDLFFQERRDYFLKLIEPTLFEPIKSKGTYFQLVSFKEYGSRPEREMAEWLTREVGVAAIPVSVFFHDQQENDLIRFCFVKKMETLKKAAERLCKI